MGSVAASVGPGEPAGTTTTTKLLPPAPPAALLHRDRLHFLLEGALERRLTTVVAEAGYGKSTLLAAWAADAHCAWYGCSPEDASLAAFARGLTDALRLRVPGLPPDIAGAVTSAAGPGTEQDEPTRARGFAALVCEALQDQLHRDLVLVVDDLHELTSSAGALQLVESLCRQTPARLHLVLASRIELPFPIERLRGQGQVLEITGSDLRFDVRETRELLEAFAGPEQAGTSEELYDGTGGWPAAVRLAVETLRGVDPDARSAALERIRRPGGPLFAYLATEVFAHEPPEVEELVRLVAPLERFTPELCDALGASNSAETLGSLARRGLFVEHQGQATSWYSLGAPVREFALAGRAEGAAEARDVQLRAGQWLEEHGDPENALRCYASAGDREEAARLLAVHGQSLLYQGAVDAILEAVALVPAELRDPAIDQLAGEASQVRGNWDEALRCFERAAGEGETLPPALAWRMGVLHHWVGRLDEAVDTYSRGEEDGEPRDVALLLAWRASAHWLRSDVDACRADATRAFEIASGAGDPQALAAAHNVLAMLAALEGDRGANDAHYLRALDYAQQAGDVLQLIRVRTNRGSRYLEEGAYDEAIAELGLALRLADIAGFAAFRALALSNRGEVLSKLGRFEEAVADLEGARELYQRLGSRMVAYPLGHLADIYRQRGDWALARAAYEQALAQAEQSGDVQGLVPALVGLARVLVVDEPRKAERMIERALSIEPGLGHAHALLGAGWVALARGDRSIASVRAAEAVAEAGVRRDRAALAESLELRALASSRPARERGRLQEAAAIWRELRNPVGEARTGLIAATLAQDEAAAEAAEERLRALGVRGALAVIAPLDASPPVAVQSLGRFRVLRRGEPLPLAAWQSRKARDLLKILIARRGRPTPRDYLMEALWPEQSPDRLGNRLSVLLSTVRSVLDPDKHYDPDHFAAADKSAVWLQYDNVAVDVERFLATAVEALDVHRSGSSDGPAGLATAEALYSGDFLEEDAYEDWALALREEARALYVEVTRALAEDTAARGDADTASRFFLRILERDPYDEPAHLGLIGALESAGRHGEARRCFRAYCARMDAIGIESAPFPTFAR